MTARTAATRPAPLIRSSSRGDGGHRIARVAASAALAALLGCAGDAPPPAIAARDDPPARGGLVVELHFGADADLDLYVSDPNEETAYFANTPVRSGGEYPHDLRCDADATRVEVVRWEVPPRGRYRVGVDFPERCDAGTSTARYRVRVAGPAGVQELEGEALFGRFDARVLDFEIGR